MSSSVSLISFFFFIKETVNFFNGFKIFDVVEIVAAVILQFELIACLCLCCIYIDGHGVVFSK